MLENLKNYMVRQHHSTKCNYIVNLLSRSSLLPARVSTFSVTFSIFSPVSSSSWIRTFFFFFFFFVGSKVPTCKDECKSILGRTTKRSTPMFFCLTRIWLLNLLQFQQTRTLASEVSPIFPPLSSHKQLNWHVLEIGSQKLLDTSTEKTRRKKQKTLILEAAVPQHWHNLFFAKKKKKKGEKKNEIAQPPISRNQL